MFWSNFYVALVWFVVLQSAKMHCSVVFVQVCEGEGEASGRRSQGYGKCSWVEGR